MFSIKEEDWEESQTRFIAGTRYYNRDLYANKKTKVAEYINNLRKEIPDIRKVMIITDTISTGESLMPIVESMREAGIPFDIFTVGLPDGDKAKDKEMASKIFSGSSTRPEIYKNSPISGVTKNPHSLHADRFYPHSEYINDKKFARDEAHKVAERVVEQLIQ